MAHVNRGPATSATRSHQIAHTDTPYQMEEDPEQWRSAVDQKTGRTYWYHRVTRISRWSKPSFLSSSEFDSFDVFDEDTSVSNDLVSKKTIAKKYQREVANSADAQQSRIRDVLTEPYRMPWAHGAFADTTNELIDNPTRDSSIASSNAISCLTSSDEDSRVDALLFLSSKCGINNDAAAQLAYTENLLSNLVIIISRGGSRKCRRLALKILCSLAICEQSSFVFEDNQSWVIITQKFLHWEGDKESTLLFCILMCCLLTGPARNVIPTETNKSMSDLLGFMMDDYLDYSRDGQIDLFALQLISSTSPSSSISPGNWSFLYYLFIGAEGGQNTSALLLLVLLSSAIGSIPSSIDSHSEMETGNANDLSFIYDILHVAGGASILQGLCTTTSVTQDVRNRARKLLLEGMGKSSYLRERVLDTFLGLSLDHNSCSRNLEGRGREENTDVASNSDEMCGDEDDGEQHSVALGSLQDFLWRCYI